MKKLLFAISLALFLMIGAPAVSAQDSIKILVDGQEKYLPDAKPLITAAGKTLYPLRAIGEILGATVDWNQDQQCVTLKKDNDTIKLVAGSNKVLFNRIELEYDTSFVIIDGRVMAPLRLLAELLNCSVDWSQEGYTVLIKIKQNKSPVHVLVCNGFQVDKNIGLDLSFPLSRISLACPLITRKNDQMTKELVTLKDLLCQQIPRETVEEAIRYSLLTPPGDKTKPNSFYFNENKSFVNVIYLRQENFINQCIFSVYQY